MFILKHREPSAIFIQGSTRLRIAFVNASVARITWIEGCNFKESASLIVIAPANFFAFRVIESDAYYLIATDTLQIQILKETGALRFLDVTGRLLLQEPRRGGKWLTPKKI
jgi:alpha-D-xyloside xylohydrolase